MPNGVLIIQLVTYFLTQLIHSPVKQAEKISRDDEISDSEHNNSIIFQKMFLLENNLFTI